MKDTINTSELYNLDKGAYEEAQRKLCLSLQNTSGVKPKSAVFTNDVASYLNGCFPQSFEQFLFAYELTRDFDPKVRSMERNFGFTEELSDLGGLTDWSKL